MLYGERARQAGEKAGGGEGPETDTEIGSTEAERDEAHAIWPEKGRGTSMPTQEPREATPTTVGWALEEADGNAMDSVFRLGRKSLVLFLGTCRWMCG